MDIPRRRFTILDGIIVVAAATIAFVWSRGAVNNFLDVYRSVPAASLDHCITSGLTIPVPTLVLATFATLIIRSLRPRPSWRKTALQPGFVACAAAALAVCSQGVLRLGTVTVKRLLGFTNCATPVGALQHLAAVDLFDTGEAVIAAWLTLILIRGWRAEPTWIDRLGRLIGFFWIILALVNRFNFLRIYA